MNSSTEFKTPLKCRETRGVQRKRAWAESVAAGLSAFTSLTYAQQRIYRARPRPLHRSLCLMLQAAEAHSPARCENQNGKFSAQQLALLSTSIATRIDLLLIGFG